MARGRNGTSASLVRMAERDPELAGRMLMAALPAAAAPVQGSLDYRLVLDQVGEFDVSIREGKATVAERNGDGSAEGDGSAKGGGKAAGAAGDFTLSTDPLTLARMAGGASPLRLLLGGRMRVRGKRRRALRLRQLAGDLTMRDIARAGTPDPDLVYRALPYAIDPEWARGHTFCLAYRMEADDAGPGGEWFVRVADGDVATVPEPPEGGSDATLRFTHSTWLGLVRGELEPSDVMRKGLVKVDGSMHPVTLIGRWLDRSEGRDAAELQREGHQGSIQGRRATWGSVAADGAGDGAGIDPAESAGGIRLMSYEELYALWERQNWRAHEIDFTVDKRHWLATPSAGQEDTMWSLSNFYLGEERVAADLAPFVMAAPSGEAEIFLSTQLVDEARHAAFFDRFMAEVMALEPEDIRGRLAQMEERVLPAWREVFDDHLRGTARRLLETPGDPDLFVEGVVTYHMVIEGVLAMTGQHIILKYMVDHDLYPGFAHGFKLVERDEHRHIAFGVRFLRDACEREPRYRGVIRDKLLELVPIAAHVFVPPGVEDASDFTSYDFHSSEIYGFAYRALKRRMAVIGVEVPSAEELMPGPISQPAAA